MLLGEERLAVVEVDFEDRGRMNDARMELLRHLPELQFLRLYNSSDITDRGLAGLAKATNLKRLELQDTRVASTVRVLVGYKDTIYVAGFTPDQRSIVTAGSDGCVRLWDFAAARRLPVVGSGATER